MDDSSIDDSLYITLDEQSKIQGHQNLAKAEVSTTFRCSLDLCTNFYPRLQ